MPLRKLRLFSNVTTLVALDLHLFPFVFNPFQNPTIKSTLSFIPLRSLPNRHLWRSAVDVPCIQSSTLSIRRPVLGHTGNGVSLQRQQHPCRADAPALPNKKVDCMSHSASPHSSPVTSALGFVFLLCFTLKCSPVGIWTRARARLPAQNTARKRLASDRARSDTLTRQAVGRHLRLTPECCLFLCNVHSLIS